MKSLHKFLARAQASSQSSANSAGDTTGMGPLLAMLPKRLMVFALTMAAFYLVGIILNVIAMRPDTFGWHKECVMTGLIIHVLLFADSLGMAWTAKRNRVKPETMVKLGHLYLIAGAFAISFAEMAQPGVSGMSFVAVLIVVYPLFVPTKPHAMLAVALMAAGMGVAAQFLHEAMVGAPVEGAIWQRHLGNVGAAMLAVIPMKLLWRMSRAVSEAQRMGSYELVEKLGAGGMGEVWRASHRMLRRPAAVKVIHPAALGAATPERSRGMLKRFEREAQETALLHSPHTIQIYDFGATEDGAFFYVMEYLEGFDARTLVERFGPVSPARAIHIVKQICDSLADAHQSGLVHRDIKPANIFVCRYGHRVDFVKVLDFGLVKAADDNEQTRLTAEGATAGTPACMAPEMAIGEGPLDGRADIYSLGCVAYFLLTGQQVFEASSVMKTVLMHVNESPVPLSERTELEIPEGLETLIMKCLSKDPADRPQSARELAQGIEAIELEETWGEARMNDWWRLNAPEGTAGTSIDDRDNVGTAATRTLMPSLG